MSPTTHMIFGSVALFSLVINIITILLKLRNQESIKLSIILAIVSTILMIYFFMRSMPVLTTLQI